MTTSVPCAEPPSASVAVTRQRMLSPGSTTGRRQGEGVCSGRRDIRGRTSTTSLAWPTGSLSSVCRRRDLWLLRYRSVLYWWSLVSGRICTSVTTGSEFIDGYCRCLVPSPRLHVGRGDVTEDIVAQSTTDGDRVSVSVVAEEIFVGVPVPPVCLAHWWQSLVCRRQGLWPLRYVECCTGRHIGVGRIARR